MDFIRRELALTMSSRESAVMINFMVGLRLERESSTPSIVMRTELKYKSCLLDCHSNIEANLFISRH